MKAHNLNKQFRGGGDVICTLRDIKQQKLNSRITLQNYGKTWIEYMEQMTYAVASIMLK